MHQFLNWARGLNGFVILSEGITHSERIDDVAKVINLFLGDELSDVIKSIHMDDFLNHLKDVLSSDPDVVRSLQLIGINFMAPLHNTMSERSLSGHVFGDGESARMLYLKAYRPEIAWENWRLNRQPVKVDEGSIPSPDSELVQIMDLVERTGEQDEFADLIESTAHLPSDLTWTLYLHKGATAALQRTLLKKQQVFNPFSGLLNHNRDYRYIHHCVAEACLHLGLRGSLPEPKELFARVNETLVFESRLTSYPWLLIGDQEKLTECLIDLDQKALDYHVDYLYTGKFPMPGSYIPGETELKKALAKAGAVSALDAVGSHAWRKMIDQEINRIFFNEHAVFLDIAVRREPEHFMKVFEAQSDSNRIDITSSLVGMLVTKDCRSGKLLQTHRIGNFSISIYSGASGYVESSLEYEFGTIGHDQAMIEMVGSMINMMSKTPDGEYDISSFDGNTAAFFLRHDLLDQNDVRQAMKSESVRKALSGVKLSRSVVQKMTPSQRDHVMGRDLGL